MDLQKEVPLPFNPRDPAYRRKLFVRIVHENGVRWHIFWRRVGLVLTGAAVAGWLLLAAGLWGFLRYRRQWDGASYAQLVLYPWTKDEVRRGLAAHNLRLGSIEIEKGNYSEGYALLAAGLRWQPQDLNARRLLAVTDVRYRNIPRALNRLAEGVRYNPDLEYYKLLFGWLLEAQQDDRVLTLGRELLPAQPTSDRRHQFIALQVAAVHFEHGRYDEMEALIATWQLEGSLEAQILLARRDWERGLESQAIARLDGELGRFGDRDELYLQLIKFHRDAGNEPEARRIALLRHFNTPASSGPRIDLLHSYRATGDYAAESREIAKYLEEFGRDAKSLELLAWYAADTLQGPLVDIVCKRAQALGVDRREMELARVQLALTEQRFADVVELCNRAGEAKVGGDDWRFPAFRAVALFAVSDPQAAGALKAAIAPVRVRTSEALLLARHLRMIGQPAAARSVLEHCHTYDPQGQAVLAEVIRIDAETQNRDGLGQALARYLAMRKPLRAVIEEALLALDPVHDGSLVTQLRRALQQTNQDDGSSSATGAIAHAQPIAR